MDSLSNSFQLLGEYRQFIIYKLSLSETRLNKLDKIPIDPNSGMMINALNDRYHLTITDALPLAKILGPNYGVGFVLTKSDPFWCIDIDNCITPENKWNDIATKLMTDLDGAAMEVSCSGKGIHIMGCGNIPLHKCKNSHYNLELYTEDRFIALTGNQARGRIDYVNDAVMHQIVQNYFNPVNNSTVQATWTTEAIPEWSGIIDDHELITKACESVSARAVFGSSVSFRDLWEANVEVLSKKYPSSKEHAPYDASSVDLVLAMHLAFWTGNNCERIKTLMFKSALVRDKWNREDYITETILKACAAQKNHYKSSRSRKPESSIEVPEGITTTNQSSYMTLDQQLELFKHCVYVTDEHKILTPKGDLLNNERFRVEFGGRSFPMDAANQKVTRNAWEAATESQILRIPRVNSTCFKPAFRPGEILEREGRTYVNMWFPPRIKRVSGDPTPFLRHLERLWPDERDRAILLSYAAAVVRYPGVKFTWCPVIQGVQGNGKTLITYIIAYCVGMQYCHFPQACEIGNRFNSWLDRKIFIAINEIHFTIRDVELFEILKSLITDQFKAIEHKNRDQLNREICANFIITTNHKDGLRKTESDRRFAPLFTAQQSLDDLKRDGLLSGYFNTYFDWLKNKDGYAIIAEFLNNYDIPAEFNPAIDCDRAPITTSTSIAIKEGVGSLEQEIIEAIEQDQIGFRKGWVSSKFLDDLLTRMGAHKHMPHSKRREIMRSLGYDWHPHLPFGRVNNVILPDGTKPKLYIHRDHPAVDIREPAKIAKAYSDDQDNTRG